MKGTQPNMQDQMRKKKSRNCTGHDTKEVEQSLTKMGHNIIYHSPLAKA